MRAHEVFAALAERARLAPVPELSGIWQFDVRDAGTWTLVAEHGSLRVEAGPPAQPPKLRVELSEEELDELARGSGHENIVTAMLRGAVHFEGDARSAHELMGLFPLPQAA